MQVADRIKKIRITANISQDIFAYSIGVSRAHISKVETGKAVPSKQLIKSICREWDIREKWILEGKGPADKKPPLTREQIQEFESELEIIGYESASRSFHGAIIMIKGVIDLIKSFNGFKLKSDHPKAIKFLENKKLFQKSLKKLQKIFTEKNKKEFKYSLRKTKSSSKNNSDY